MRAMWLILQQDAVDDYVVATGQIHSVKQFCQKEFACAGLDHQDYVHTDERYLRPAEVDLLLGDAAKAREKINWQPRVSFEQLVEQMVQADLERARREKILLYAGHDMPIKIAA